MNETRGVALQRIAEQAPPPRSETSGVLDTIKTNWEEEKNQFIQGCVRRRRLPRRFLVPLLVKVVVGVVLPASSVPGTTSAAAAATVTVPVAEVSVLVSERWREARRRLTPDDAASPSQSLISVKLQITGGKAGRGG